MHFLCDGEESILVTTQLQLTLLFRKLSKYSNCIKILGVIPRFGSLQTLFVIWVGKTKKQSRSKTNKCCLDITA